MESNETHIVLEIECGANKAKLYLDKVQMGSKGQCVFFEDSWLTPNEFQFVSGRETAKDWKRSIKHHDKSLKLLMSRGLLSLSPAECRCEHCAEGSPGIEKYERVDGENVRQATDGSLSSQSEHDSTTKTNSKVAVHQISNHGHSKTNNKLGNCKQKAEKRKRDKTPKTKGKRGTKKQGHSRESSEGEKNILKLKRVEDSKEYVSSVISSHRKYDESKTSEEKTEITENGTSRPVKTENLSAHDEDTDYYADEMDEEGEEVQNKLETVSNRRLISPNDRQSGVVVTNHDTPDNHPTSESVDGEPHIKDKRYKIPEPTGMKEVEHTTETFIGGEDRVRSKEQLRSGEIINDVPKIKQSNLIIVPEHVRKAFSTTVRNKADTNDVRTKGHSFNKFENVSLLIKPASGEYDADTDNGIFVDNTTNKTMKYIGDSKIKTEASGDNRQGSPPSRDFVDVKFSFSPKKRGHLTSINDQLRTDNKSLTIEMDSNRQDCPDCVSWSEPKQERYVSGIETDRCQAVRNGASSDEETPAMSSPTEAPPMSEHLLTPKEPQSTPLSPPSPREPASVSHSPLNIDYSDLLSYHIGLARKAEGRISQATDDKNDTIKDSHSPHKKPHSETATHKHQGSNILLTSKPGRGDSIASVPCTNLGGLPGYDPGYPSHPGLPYMPYPFYHPALVPPSGLPTTGVPPEALANTMLYSSLYGIHPAIATSLCGGGLGAAKLGPNPRLGVTSDHGKSQSHSLYTKSQICVKNRKTGTCNYNQNSDRENNREFKAKKVHTSGSPKRHSLSKTVDLSRKAEFAYDQCGALDLTTSVKRSAEESTIEPTAKKTYFAENDKHKYHDSPGEVSRGHRGGDSEGHHHGHSECRPRRQLERLGNRQNGNRGHGVSEGQNQQLSHQGFFSDLSKSDVFAASISRINCATLSSASNVTSVSDAPLAAGTASTHARSLAHGYHTTPINPAALGLLQQPFLYPFTV